MRSECALPSRVTGQTSRAIPAGILCVMPLRVRIVTAERESFAEDDVDMVVAPGSEGVVGILPRHAPLLTTLQPGLVRVKRGGSEEALSVGGGFLQVARNRVLILADTAERADEIDETR